MADKQQKKNTDKPRQRRITQFQDVPPEVRAEITEFLQPPHIHKYAVSQAGLRNAYMSYASDRNILKELEDAGDDPMFTDMVKRQMERSKSHYSRRLAEATKAPGIWETYRYFWDEHYPFPDQDDNQGAGGNNPITS